MASTFLSSSSYALPSGFNIFDIECWGTNGESKFGFNGGIGGYIKGRFASVAQNLQIDIGGTGNDGSYYHGGSANVGSGGGAGAGVRLQMATNALIVAGGGGGSRSVPNQTDGGAGGDTQGQAGVVPNSGGKQNAGGTGQDTWNNGSYRFGGPSGFSDGTGGAGGGGGGGFYGGGATGSIFAAPGSGGGGGGGSNGYELQSGVILLEPIVTLRGGSPLIPLNPGGIGGAVRITPLGWYSASAVDVETYTVPEGVQCLQVQLWGANGGPSSFLPGSNGGYCEAQIQVSSGDNLGLSVGGAGGLGVAGASPGGFLTGGAPNSFAVLAMGGGGGAGTGILFGSNLIIAAGGGGGSSSSTNLFYQGGDGGGTVGSNGSGYPLSGQGGQIGTGGVGGIGNAVSGSAGLGSLGGDGANDPDALGTGGGGGGYTGGGGGGTSDPSSSPSVGSGGGGSSNYDPASPLPISFFNTIPDIVAPANPDVNGNGAIIIIPGACICVARGTCVDTIDGEIEIQNLKPGVCLKDCNGDFDIVRMVVQNKVTPRQFLQCQTGCFGMVMPNKELLITKEHPMLIKGKEVTGDVLLNSEISGIELIDNFDVLPVFTLVTDRRTFVKMNGVFVATWSESAWLNFVDNDCTGKFV